MIQPEWHTNRKTQASVFAGRCDTNKIGKNIIGAIEACTITVFEIDECDGIVLPRHFGREPDVVAASLAIDQLWLTDIEAQVRERRRCAVAVKGFALPGCCKRNLYAEVPLAAGDAQAGNAY